MTIEALQKAKRDLVNELMACDEASEVDRPWYEEVVRCVVGAGWRPVLAPWAESLHRDPLGHFERNGGRGGAA